MKPVTAHARGCQVLGQCKFVILRWHAGMIGRIETGDLRQSGKGLTEGAYSGKIMGLMEWGQRIEGFKLRQNV